MTHCWFRLLWLRMFLYAYKLYTEFVGCVRIRRAQLDIAAKCLDFVSAVPGKHNGCFFKSSLISERNLRVWKSLYKEMYRQYLYILICLFYFFKRNLVISELFPWAKSSMCAVEWVKNNFCRGNKLRITGFTTILQLVLSITLKGKAIGINTAKQCKYSNLHKQINTSRLLLWDWMQTAHFIKKNLCSPIDHYLYLTKMDQVTKIFNTFLYI